MPATVPLTLREVSDRLQRGPSPAMSMASRPPLVRNRMPLWIAIAILSAIALAWVLPPASSYRVATPTPQWITGL
jgi:hypothetical protein